MLAQWFRPRSLGLHFLFLLVAGGCLLAAWWQIHRAAAGNTLSYLYAIEWPTFAVVAAIGWWQLVHDTPEDIAARREYHARVRAASAEVVARSLPPSERALTVPSTEVARAAAIAPPGSAPETASLAVTDRSASPVARADPAEPVDDLDEYNRILALLAVRGRAKTWRNPRGL